MPEGDYGLDFVDPDVWCAIKKDGGVCVSLCTTPDLTCIKPVFHESRISLTVETCEDGLDIR